MLGGGLWAIDGGDDWPGVSDRQVGAAKPGDATPGRSGGAADWPGGATETDPLRATSLAGGIVTLGTL